MSLILRLCSTVPKSQCFKGLSSITRNVTCVKCSSQNVKTLASSLQVKYFSTKSGIDPEKNTLLYYGPLTTKMLIVKVFSLSTSFIGLCCQPYLYYHVFGTENLKPFIGASTLMILFAVLSPIILHQITKKYISKVYYNHERDYYTAVIFSFLARKVEIKFTPDDVRVPDLPGMFSSFYIRDMPFFVDAEDFTDNKHYIRIMGFDKPVDFELSHVNNEVEQPPTLENRKRKEIDNK